MIKSPTEEDLKRVKASLRACYLGTHDIYELTSRGKFRIYTPRRVRAMIEEMAIPAEWIWSMNQTGPDHSRAHQGIVAWVLIQGKDWLAPEWMREFVTAADEEALMLCVEGWICGGIMLSDGWYGISAIEWID